MPACIKNALDVGSRPQGIGRVTGAASATDFDAMMQERERIAAAYSNGNPKPLDAVVAREGPATFFAPHGRIVQGNAAVAKQYHRDAKMFSSGSKSKLDILDAGASGEIGYWVGLQHFQGTTGGKTQSLTLRITEIFRRVRAEWKLVHRHADG